MNKREHLMKEQQQIRDRHARRREAERRDEQRLVAIATELHRLRLLELVGVAGGVQLAYRRSSGDRLAKFNDTKGTLTSVRRTRVSVEFDAESWQMPLDQLLAADDHLGQGYRVTF